MLPLIGVGRFFTACFSMRCIMMKRKNCQYQSAFRLSQPHQKWITDISYSHTGQGVLCLSMIRGLFDQSIVACKTAASQTVNLVRNTVWQAIRKDAVAAEVQLHSDQGIQYTSSAYFNLTKEMALPPSRSRRGNCYDNAMAEDFFYPQSGIYQSP
jgi:putative transposase